MEVAQGQEEIVIELAKRSLAEIDSLRNLAISRSLLSPRQHLFQCLAPLLAQRNSATAPLDGQDFR